VCWLFVYVQQGKAKAKLLSTLSSALGQTHKYLGAEIEDGLVTASQLKEGLNVNQVILGGLVCVIPSKDRVP